jgi:hypothetical protein
VLLVEALESFFCCQGFSIEVYLRKKKKLLRGGRQMSGLLTKDLAYKQWVQSLSKKFRQSQIKAAVKVNREMLAFYWELGRDIVEMKAESRWGSGFMEALSQDLQRELPGVKGLSSTNLRYIKRFYLLYSQLFQAQAVPELGR